MHGTRVAVYGGTICFGFVSGASAVLRECVATGASWSGMSVAGDRTRAKLAGGCKITLCGDNGLQSDRGAYVEGEDCMFERNGQMGATSRGGTMILTSCRSEGNKQGGYWVQENGHMVLRDCTSIAS
jgi:hypothetical protein